MNLKLSHFSAVTLVLLVCSCATTSLRQTWKSPDARGQAFKKIAVIAVDDRAMIRQVFEGQLATQLEAQGQAALRTHELMTIAEMKESKQRTGERLRQAGVDGVLIQRLVARETPSVGEGRAHDPQTPSFSSGTLGWFDYYCVVMPSPTVLSVDLTQDFYIETTLYDLASEKRMWSCLTRTAVKENADWLELVKPLALTIVQAMVKDGVIH
jgi:hypothetical protein